MRLAQQVERYLLVYPSSHFFILVSNEAFEIRPGLAGRVGVGSMVL